MRYIMDLSNDEWRKQLFYSIPTGWWIRFGEKMCDDIENEVKKMMPAAQKDFRITKAREENGSLKIVAPWATQGLREIFEKYKDLSIHTCIDCGKPAEYYAWDMAEPYCAKHTTKNSVELNEYLAQSLKEV